MLPLCFDGARLLCKMCATRRRIWCHALVPLYTQFMHFLRAPGIVCEWICLGFRVLMCVYVHFTQTCHTHMSYTLCTYRACV